MKKTNRENGTSSSTYLLFSVAHANAFSHETEVTCPTLGALSRFTSERTQWKHITAWILPLCTGWVHKGIDAPQHSHVWDDLVLHKYDLLALLFGFFLLLHHWISLLPSHLQLSFENIYIYYNKPVKLMEDNLPFLSEHYYIEWDVLWITFPLVSV